MGRRFGRIFQRYGKFYIRWRRDGVEAVRVAGTKRSHAEKLLARIEAAYWEGRATGRPQALPRVSLAAIWAQARPVLEARWSPTTFRAEGHRIDVAAEWFREPVSQITPSRIGDFLGWLREERGASPATRNRYLRTLSVLFQEAVARGAAASNPTEGVKASREEQRPPPRLREGDVVAIIAAAPEWARGAIRLAAETGLRRAEVVALDWSDVDAGAGLVVVRRAKSKRSREVTLSPAAVSLLAVLPRVPGPVFPGVTADALTRAFAGARKAAGFPGVRLHDLRAFFIRQADERGAPAHVIRDLAGHGSLAVTNRYLSAASLDAKRKAVGGSPGVLGTP